MVRAGLGDDSGAKLIEQRGIDFAPVGDLVESLKAAGASEAFLKTLGATKPPTPKDLRISIVESCNSDGLFLGAASSHLRM